jgi:hypothetical protein
MFLSPDPISMQFPKPGVSSTMNYIITRRQSRAEDETGILSP